MSRFSLYSIPVDEQTYEDAPEPSRRKSRKSAPAPPPEAPTSNIYPSAPANDSEPVGGKKNRKNKKQSVERKKGPVPSDGEALLEHRLSELRAELGLVYDNGDDRYAHFDNLQYRPEGIGRGEADLDIVIEYCKSAQRLQSEPSEAIWQMDPNIPLALGANILLRSLEDQGQLKGATDIKSLADRVRGIKFAIKGGVCTEAHTEFPFSTYIDVSGVKIVNASSRFIPGIHACPSTTPVPKSDSFGSKDAWCRTKKCIEDHACFTPESSGTNYYVNTHTPDCLMVKVGSRFYDYLVKNAKRYDLSAEAIQAKPNHFDGTHVKIDSETATRAWGDARSVHDKLPFLTNLSAIVRRGDGLEWTNTEYALADGDEGTDAEQSTGILNTRKRDTHAHLRLELFVVVP